MRNIRKISFCNAAGERRCLNGEHGIYAVNLTGFGLSLAPSYENLGRGFFAITNEESEPQASPAFTLTFTKDPYAAYAELMDWLAAAGAITVAYDPTGSQEYYRDVSIKSAGKSELNKIGWLEVPMVLSSLGPWYRPAPADLMLESSEADGVRRYDYEYTEDLRYGADRTGGLVGAVASTGHIPGALVLTYTGAIVNPVIRLTGEVSGKTYGVCAISAIISDTDTLQVSTRYGNSYVKRISADGQETDLIDALDISSSPFFRIPTSEPCILSVEADGILPGRANLQVFYYFRTV